MCKTSGEQKLVSEKYRSLQSWGKRSSLQRHEGASWFSIINLIIVVDLLAQLVNNAPDFYRQKDFNQVLLSFPWSSWLSRLFWTLANCQKSIFPPYMYGRVCVAQVCTWVSFQPTEAHCYLTFSQCAIRDIESGWLSPFFWGSVLREGWISLL